MPRNWGIPAKAEDAAFTRARQTRPVATLGATAAFGVVGAAIAAMSFDDARDLIENVFHGWSLIFAIIAAGAGCWTYVWLARPRFAAHFTGRGDGFLDLMRFYGKASLSLLAAFGVAKLVYLLAGAEASAILLCLAGGAGAAAAFQTVLAFVPDYQIDQSSS